MTVRTVSQGSTVAAEAVRTSYETAAARFGVRLPPSELEAWKVAALDHGVSLSDMVRGAMAFAIAQMPAGHVRAELAKRESALQSGASSFVQSVIAGLRPDTSHPRARSLTGFTPFCGNGG